MAEPDRQSPDSEASAADTAPERSDIGLVVGIGASAGGLGAFKSFFKNMPADSGMAFVLVQHLDPHHASMLVELIAPHTQMPVAQAQDGETVASNHVYIIPPDATLTIKGGALRVAKPAPAREHRRPIDTFFTSLAEDQKDCAVSIVLSGVGSDGTVGLRAVKAAGGLTLAQAEFDETAMPGMPTSAAATGLVDHVVPVEAMPRKLLDHREKLKAAREWTDAQATKENWTEHLAAVAMALRRAVGHDFADYKENTVIRRVQRRMQATQIASVSAYLARLDADPHEADLLFRELLIGVTRFFRDSEAFEALSARLFPALFEERQPGEPIRVWVPGCATGEEVYSLAILIAEVMEAACAEIKVQIFGTDLDANAIAVARAARYRKPVEGVSPDRARKWFVDDGDACWPAKAIREMCVFSSHSLIRDPPFSKLDLISCRNVLIYLNSELQHRVVETFHYALKPGGILFLGPSEGVARDADLFDVLDRRHRILRRRDTATSPFLASRSLPAPQAAPAADPPALSDDRIDRSARRVVEPYAPAYFVIDRHHDVVRFSGGEAGKYLEPTTGAASLNLFSLLRRDLRSMARTAVLAARTERRGVKEDVATRSSDGQSRVLSLIVEPIESDLLVVALREPGAADGEDSREAREMRPFTVFGHRLWPLGERPRTAASEGDGEGATATEQELRATKAQLKAAVSELETYMEEAKSANEEMQSVNEELQSSNEELETSKEEMQSINEELQTVNAELQNKNAALSRANDDLQNLLDSTRIATLFLDGELRIRNFTPAMTAIFPLRTTDLGRPIADMVSTLKYEDLARDAEDVQRSLVIIEREVKMKESGDDATFLLRVRPYRTRDNRLDGVVMTFVDTTVMTRAEAGRRRAELSFDLASQAAGIGAWHWSLDTDAIIWSPETARLLGGDPAIPVPPPYEELRALVHPEDIAGLEERVREGLATKTRWESEFRIVRPGGVRWMLAGGSVILDASDKPVAMVGVLRDVTERKHMDVELQESEERYRTLFNSIDEGFCVIEMIFDERGKPVDYRFLQTSPSFEKQTGLKDARGKTMRELAPEHEEHWFETYGEIALTGEPARFQNRAAQLNRWYDVYAFRFGAAENRQVAVLFNDITEPHNREEHLRVVMHELAHRAKNLLLVIQTMASQTARTSPSISEFLESFYARIQAMARSHDLLAETNWQGAHLEAIVRQHVRPFLDEDASRLEIGGPPVVVSSRAAQAIGLALHELATNASKYGALSAPEGRVVVRWALDGPDGATRFRMTWRERGGPPVEAPRRSGFGQVLIERLTAEQLGGGAELGFPSEGVTWTLEAPAAEVLLSQEERG